MVIVMLAPRYGPGRHVLDPGSWSGVWQSSAEGVGRVALKTPGPRLGSLGLMNVSRVT